MRDLLERLHALRGSFDRASRIERRGLLQALARSRWSTAAALGAWHDELLFTSAFPDAGPTLRLARRALRDIAGRVRALPRAERDALADSGMAGTLTSHTFNHGAARWLAAQGESIRFVWDDAEDAARLDALLRSRLTPAESDRFDDGSVTTAGWLAEAAGGDAHVARWLLAPRARVAVGARASSRPSAATDATARALYDDAEPPLHWSLGDSRNATTHARVPVRPVLRTRFRALPPDPVAHIATPLAGIRRARGPEARAWHDASMAALLARTREVFPTIYANPDEVHLAPLGEGAVLCIIGAAPADRSVLEANYGYVMFSNGVPIGYGGVTPFAAQANTGANIFESFRRSEAPFLFAQSLRAFRTLFGVTRFLVNPYQFGEGNDEAIASGAYWFYDRLGFRPVRPRLAALAARERARIAADRAHRTSARTLRALATGDVVLTLPGAERTTLVPESLLVDSGALATRAMRGVAAADRDTWIDAEAERLCATCTGRRRRLSPAERRGARLLVPALAPVRAAIARFPRDERAAVWRLVALKGAAQEVGFARAAAELPRLWRALQRAVAINA